MLGEKRLRPFPQQDMPLGVQHIIERPIGVAQALEQLGKGMRRLHGSNPFRFLFRSLGRFFNVVLHPERC